MSQFAFLQREWPAVHEAAARAEAAAHPDPRTACFYARRTLELAVGWVYKSDASLRLPYQDNLSALIHEPTFKRRRRGGVQQGAAHHQARQPGRPQPPAGRGRRATAVRELFHVGYWLARTYARQPRPGPGLDLKPEALPRTAPVPKQTIDQLQKLEQRLRERDEKLGAAGRQGSARRRAEAAARRGRRRRRRRAPRSRTRTTTPRPRPATTSSTCCSRRPAGRSTSRATASSRSPACPTSRARASSTTCCGATTASRSRGRGQAHEDVDPRVGQQQAKLYADCLEKQFGQRPVIFYTNGYEHWLWDDANYPPRAVQGFLQEGRAGADDPAAHEPQAARHDAEINRQIVERYYQTRAIRRIGEAFEQRPRPQGAAGDGDRRRQDAHRDRAVRPADALQLGEARAVPRRPRGAGEPGGRTPSRRTCPTPSPVNLVTEKDAEGRVYVSTYPTMMGLIDETQRRPAPLRRRPLRPGRHRRGAPLGLPEVPRDLRLLRLAARRPDRDAEGRGRPQHLRPVRPRDAACRPTPTRWRRRSRTASSCRREAVSVPLKFQREGITYDELSEEEKEQWDALEWDEDGDVPDRVEAEAVNKWLFNKDTVDKVLEHLMTRGQKVAGGDRLARRSSSPRTRRTRSSSPSASTPTTRTTRASSRASITFETEYAQSLIDDFSSQDKGAAHRHLGGHARHRHRRPGGGEPRLLQAGAVEDQVLADGRPRHAAAARTCSGRASDKEFFYIFDYCQNLEFFSQDPPATEGRRGESLGKRLFKARLELIGALDQRGAPAARQARAARRRGLGRSEERRRGAPSRRERAARRGGRDEPRQLRRPAEAPAGREVRADPRRGACCTAEALGELAHEVAGLPSRAGPRGRGGQAVRPADAQACSLPCCAPSRPSSACAIRSRRSPALLEEKAEHPDGARADGADPGDPDRRVVAGRHRRRCWRRVRKRLRDLVKLHRQAQAQAHLHRLRGPDRRRDRRSTCRASPRGTDFERRSAPRHARSCASTRITSPIHKLRMNKPLTAADLDELERMLIESGIGDAERHSSRPKTKRRASVCSCARSSASTARPRRRRSAASSTGKTLTANQIEFVNLIVDHLTEHGVMDGGAALRVAVHGYHPAGPGRTVHIGSRSRSWLGFWTRSGTRRWRRRVPVNHSRGEDLAGELPTLPTRSRAVRLGLHAAGRTSPSAPPSGSVFPRGVATTSARAEPRRQHVRRAPEPHPVEADPAPSRPGPLRSPAAGAPRWPCTCEARASAPLTIAASN